MRAIILLAIGLVFLCLALLGMVSVPFLEKPEVRHIATERIPGATFQLSPNTVTPGTPASPESIGMISAEEMLVESGPSDNLSPVANTEDFFNHSAVRVTNGGTAKLDFFANQISIRLFSDTVIGDVSASSGTADPLVRMKLEFGGLSGEVTKNGIPARFEISNGVKVYILSGQFLILYDPETSTTYVANFDGTIAYSIPGQQAVQFVQAGQIYEISQSFETTKLPLNFTRADIENLTSNSRSTLLATLKDYLEPVPTPTPTSTPTLSPTSHPPPLLTIIPLPTKISPCDKAELIADVTIPDGTIFSPGATFTKTWRLKNVGSCEWNTSYQLVFLNGEQMGAAALVAFPKNVPVGENLDISINMTAPSPMGSYRGYWMFQNADGTLFGIGPGGNRPFWVDIKVDGPTVTPGGPTQTFAPTVTPGGPTITPISITPQPTAVVIDIPTQLVEVEWPTRLKVKQSGTIRVSLIKVGEKYTPTVEISGSSNTAVVSTPILVGTPGQETSRAFGEGYEASAIAHIAGAAFEINLASPESQVLDQTQVDWIWNVASDDVGLQGIDISVEIEWRPVDQGKQTIKRQIWRSHLEIEVSQPFISTGQVSTFSLFSAFIGSGLSIPWLYEMISKRKRKPKKQRAVRQNKK